MKDVSRTDSILCLMPQPLHHCSVRTILLNLSMPGRHDPRGGGCETPISQAITRPATVRPRKSPRPYFKLKLTKE
eukprot:42845-Rhodomonas_salina.1